MIGRLLDKMACKGREVLSAEFSITVGDWLKIQIMSALLLGGIFVLLLRLAPPWPMELLWKLKLVRAARWAVSSLNVQLSNGRQVDVFAFLDDPLVGATAALAVPYVLRAFMVVMLIFPGLELLFAFGAMVQWGSLWGERKRQTMAEAQPNLGGQGKVEIERTRDRKLEF